MVRFYANRSTTKKFKLVQTLYANDHDPERGGPGWPRVGRGDSGSWVCTTWRGGTRAGARLPTAEREHERGNQDTRLIKICGAAGSDTPSPNLQLLFLLSAVRCT